MRARAIVVVLGVVALVALVHSERATGAVPYKSSLILDDSEEASSLRALLTDPAATRLIHSAGQENVLWVILTSPSVGQEEGCDQQGFRHSFLFAPRRPLSSRAYELGFCMQPSPGGEAGYDLVSVEGRFVSWTPAGATDVPIASGRYEFEILRQALLNEDLALAMRDILASYTIQSITVERNLERQVDEIRQYIIRFHVAMRDSPPGDNQLSTLSYLGAFDPQALLLLSITPL